MTFAELVDAACSWLAASRPVRLVIALDGGTLSVRAECGSDPGPPPEVLRAACSEWTLDRDDGVTRLRAVPDPARVAGTADEPATLYALHDLAARHRESRLILRLPSEHVGRRW